MADIEAAASLHAIAGGLGGVLALSVLYPMDNLRTRMQAADNSLPSFEQEQQQTALTSQLNELEKLIMMSTSDRDLYTALARIPMLKKALEARLDDKTRAPASPSNTRRGAESKQHQAERRINAPQTTTSVVRRVLKDEGVLGFYKGLVSGLVGMGASWSSYYYYYNVLQRIMVQRNTRAGDGPLSNLANLLVATGAGTITCCVTNPLWVVNTRIKLKGPEENKVPPTITQHHSPPHPPTHPPPSLPTQGLFVELATLAREEGYRGLFQGLIPSLVLVSNPAVQFMFAEWLKRLLTARGVDVLQMSSFRHFWIGAASKVQLGGALWLGLQWVGA
jgi:hypothetical protein